MKPQPHWDTQLDTVIRTTKGAPKKTGLFIEDYKESYFVKRLTEALPEFTIKVLPGIIPGTKTITCTRKVPLDPSRN